MTKKKKFYKIKWIMNKNYLDNKTYSSYNILKIYIKKKLYKYMIKPVKNKLNIINFTKNLKDYKVLINKIKISFKKEFTKN